MAEHVCMPQIKCQKGGSLLCSSLPGLLVQNTPAMKLRSRTCAAAAAAACNAPAPAQPGLSSAQMLQEEPLRLEEMQEAVTMTGTTAWPAPEPHSNLPS